MYKDVNACDCTQGCTDPIRESALKVDSGRKIPCRTGESNLRQRCADPTTYQLSYILALVSTTSLTSANSSVIKTWDVRTGLE